jgi:hypothetical protein
LANFVKPVSRADDTHRRGAESSAGAGKLRTAVAAERLGDFAEMTRPGFTAAEGWA